MSETIDRVAEINALATPGGYDANKYRPQATQLLGIATVCPSPVNPRKHFDDASMAELVESVKKHGVLEPILVRHWPADYRHAPTPLPMYEIVAGERRWRAAQAAGMKLIEAKVRDLTDHEMLEIMIIENLQRAGLTPLEEAEGYERMTKEYGYTADQIADKIGKSRAYVYARLKLTALCHEARKAFDAGRLNPSTALLIARIPTTAMQEQATLEICNDRFDQEPMSYRRAAQHIQNRYMLILSDAPFAPNDGDLVPTAGTCKLCPKRTGNARDLFDDVKNPNVCTDPDCYQAKVKAHKARQIKEAKAEGTKVITGKEAEKILPYGVSYGAQGNFVALDHKEWVGDKQVPVRELLADTPPKVTLVEDKKSGALVELVDKKQLAEALKKAGVTKGNDLQAAAQKENEKKAKLESEYRRRLHGTVTTSILARVKRDGTLSRDDLVLIAESQYQRVWDETRKLIAVLWMPDDKSNRTERANALKAKIPTLETEDLLMLLLDIAVYGETHVSYYQADSTPEKLLELAKRENIDAAAIKKAVTAEAKAREKQAAGKAKKPPKSAKTAPPDPAETPPPPTPAAQAREVKRAKPKKAGDPEAATQAAPAEPLPVKAWPFPTSSDTDEETDPAPAPPANEKPGLDPAAAWPFPTAKACSTTAKSRKVTHATPTAAQPAQDTPAPRCDRTIDIFRD